MIEKLSNSNGEISLLDGIFLPPLILLGALATTVIIMWWRIVSNIAQIIHIRRLKSWRGRKYALVVWGIRKNSLMVLLIAETLVALALSALIVITMLGA